MGVSGSLLERVMDVVDIEDAGDLLDPLIYGEEEDEAVRGKKEGGFSMWVDVGAPFVTDTYSACKGQEEGRSNVGHDVVVDPFSGCATLAVCPAGLDALRAHRWIPPLRNRRIED